MSGLYRGPSVLHYKLVRSSPRKNYLERNLRGYATPVSAFCFAASSVGVLCNGRLCAMRRPTVASYVRGFHSFANMKTTTATYMYQFRLGFYNNLQVLLPDNTPNSKWKGAAIIQRMTVRY